MKKDEIQKYIELMYSQESALNHIEDLAERKIQAAIKAKLDPNDPDVKNIMNLKNKKVTTDIINFLNKNNSNAYIKLISDQQLFYRMQRQLLEEDEDADSEKLMKISERSEELVERIDKSYAKIYKEKEVIEEATKTIRMATPEQRLRERKNIA
jgi:hypothetical protein